MFIKRIILIALLAATACASLFVSVRRGEDWCDPVSGSYKHQTFWPFGIVGSPSYDVSPLEERLHAIGYQWTPAWHSYHSADETAWGMSTVDYCGSMPPIFQIAGLWDRFDAQFSADELRRFADVRRSGTEAQQKAAIAAACEKAYGGDSRPLTPK